MVDDLVGTQRGLVVEGMTGLVGNRGIFVVNAGVSKCVCEVERVDGGPERAVGRVEP